LQNNRVDPSPNPTVTRPYADYLQDTCLSKKQAEIVLKMQANASQAVLTSVETVGMIPAQDPINAALGVLKDAVNKAAGIVLL
jgi:hypothetical protein